MKHGKTTLAASAALILASIQVAEAHTVFVMDVTRVPVAGKTYTGTLNAGHGCEVAVVNSTAIKYDTERLEVVIPAGVTGVRPMDATWGKATVEKDLVSGNVTKIIWTNANVHTEDSNLYQATFRATLPDAPMTILAFDVLQVCDSGNATAAWAGKDAAKLYVQPARKPGWNKYTAQVAIESATFPNFFADAQIVWAGGAAYSPNAETTKLITNALTTIPAGLEFWVKY
jgi:hypothetical protein